VTPWRKIRKALGRCGYEILYAWPSIADYSLFNLGYWPVDDGVAADPAFAHQPNQVQLYAQLLKSAGIPPAALSGRAVLEIGAGRGGGLQYLARAASPRSLVGIDSSRAAVRYGRRRGLDLRLAVAERLPFADGMFDYVLCLDSINVCTDPPRVFAEMARVLAPGGTVMAGDFIRSSPRRARMRLERWAAPAALSIVGFEDVTAGVRLSAERDHARKAQLLAQAPLLLRPLIVESLTLKGTRRYQLWMKGVYTYYLSALVKQQAGPSGVGDLRDDP
jgi:SAM-dependent methyltransferase